MGLYFLYENIIIVKVYDATIISIKKLVSMLFEKLPKE